MSQFLNVGSDFAETKCKDSLVFCLLAGGNQDRGVPNDRLLNFSFELLIKIA